MRIGIITMYHNSVNYGGNLQAYALVKAIEKIKDEDDKVEQISYIYGREQKKPVLQIIKNFVKKILILSANFLIPARRKRKKARTAKAKAIKAFGLSIPHSDKIYNHKNIDRCVNDYDVFITGSDQVWNPIMWERAYRLDFVPSGKIKISYAASISRNSLTEAQKDVFANSLKDYSAVSVREKNTVDLIEDVSPVKVEWVLDPTMLISHEEWDEICTSRREQEKYVFCYFLSNNEMFEKRAKEFAHAKNLKLVSIAYLSSKREFADSEYSDVSPADFISFIKNAEFVLTDSFHASVFSLLYHKQFFVFERMKHKDMLTRLTSLLSMFDAEYRICKDIETNEAWYEQKMDIDYSKPFEKFEAMKQKSILYLQESINNKCLKENY
ncbi:MAG: polysaccharide pyruvyl transferase family protein [Clostridia bacterium]|nr:polysaccharide pyruvyl transferase family protein [Clostridia bacterium]